MSRIEEALEKAVKMRESAKEVVSEEISAAKPHIPPAQFEAGNALIDIDAVNKYVVTIKDPYSHAAEQYKKLRARLLRATRKDFHNTIMITSSESGEGKSLTAINLAVALSNETDYTVLLVDADLRNPSVHRYFGIEPRGGLSDYLKGEADIPDLLVKTGVGKLVILPAGNPSESSAELLSSERMKMLVRELKLRYRDRYVIFDTSPLLIIADALSLGSFMDGILFVIQEGRTAQKRVAHALDLMKGYNILGVVFNNQQQYVSKDLHPYYYRYGVQQRHQAISGSGSGGSGENKS
jgi:receptor protein-tyrosine kinase/non-specific protein-tyrosine kinase